MDHDNPQDIVILLELVTLGNRQWSYNTLAYDLAMSPSEVHSDIKRAAAARVFDSQRGHHAAGGTERRHGPVDRPSRLCPGERSHRAGGTGGGSGPGRTGEGSVSGALIPIDCNSVYEG